MMGREAIKLAVERGLLRELVGSVWLEDSLFRLQQPFRFDPCLLENRAERAFGHVSGVIWNGAATAGEPPTQLLTTRG